MSKTREPHPSTFILFRPPWREPEDDNVFKTDMEGTTIARLDYEKSCPALSGTASKKLQSIEEDRLSDASEISEDDSSRKDHFSFDLHKDFARPEPKLSKKRSFLLVDVLDEVEGVRATKRQDVHETESTFSVDSIEIAPASNRSLHRVRRQKSDFDVLYTNSRSERQERRIQPVQECADIDDGAKHPEDSFHKCSEIPGRASRLRSKKSMIALSLQRFGSVPSRSRLDGIDTHEITSFDTVLLDCSEFKTTTAGVILDTSAAPLPLSDATHRINHPVDDHNLSKSKFAKHTELLRHLPDTSQKPRKLRRDLRHAKSAKDMLEKYRIDNEKQRGSKQGVKKTTTKAFVVLKEKPEPKGDILRNNLRSLLGLRKVQHGVGA